MNTIITTTTNNALVAAHIKAITIKTGSALMGTSKALLIEEAKRQLKEHPEWSNDAIAQYCGFSDRTTLQRTFKEKTGLTPTQFIQENQ